MVMFSYSLLASKRNSNPSGRRSWIKWWQKNERLARLVQTCRMRTFACRKSISTSAPHKVGLQPLCATGERVWVCLKETLNTMVNEKPRSKSEIVAEPSHTDATEPQQPMDNIVFQDNVPQMPLKHHSESHVHIDHTARNGLITAMGVLLGFAITFLTDWGSRNGEWTAAGYLMLVGLFPGIVAITIALALLIIPYRPTVARYKKAVIVFLLGVSVIFFFIFISIFSTVPCVERLILGKR